VVVQTVDDVRIGVGDIAAVDSRGVSSLTELVDAAEAAGIDSIWLADVISSPETTDPLIGLAYAAGRTRHLKLGTGVLVLPGRNPATVAAQLAGLAALAPGRILPAFGLQPATPADRSMYPAPPGRRGDLFEEAVCVVRALLTQPSVTHHGRFFHLDDASVAPRPVRPLDLWLGGRLPVGMRRVGRLADGWLGSFVTPEEAASCRTQIVAAATDAGRAIEEDHYGTNLILALDDGSADAASAQAARLRPDLTDPGVLVSRGWAALRTDIRRFIDAGLTKFVVRPAGRVASQREFLDAFSHELPTRRS
jgi:probable F420-dependent oxidoreductase